MPTVHSQPNHIIYYIVMLYNLPTFYLHSKAVKELLRLVNGGHLRIHRISMVHEIKMTAIYTDIHNK